MTGKILPEDNKSRLWPVNQLLPGAAKCLKASRLFENVTRCWLFAGKSRSKRRRLKRKTIGTFLQAACLLVHTVCCRTPLAVTRGACIFHVQPICNLNEFACSTPICSTSCTRVRGPSKMLGNSCETDLLNSRASMASSSLWICCEKPGKSS